jgi:DNA primase
MKATWVDFRTVKARITMEMALASYGVMLRRVAPSYLRGRCPLPTHNSKSSAQSFIINTEKNAWVCHSDSCSAARSGRAGGNVLDFVSWMENCSIREAAFRLQDWFGLIPASPKTWAAPARVDLPPVDLSPPEDNRPLSFSLTGIDIHHPYLAERGVTPKTSEYFGIGLFPRKGLMAGRIVIPIHNEDGVLVAYAGRGLEQAEPKYLFPARFRKSLVLFNLHPAAQCGQTVVLVEGFFDCLNVHQAGLLCVVALMGCNLSQRQEQLLEKYFREVIVLMDGDKAGRTAGANIAGRLVSKLSTRLVEIPTGTQPDQLDADQIRCLCIPGYF